MKAMQLNNAKRGPVLIPVDVPKPELGADEVLVHVHAAGVTPTELLWYPTTHTKGEQRAQALCQGMSSQELSPLWAKMYEASRSATRFMA